MKLFLPFILLFLCIAFTAALPAQVTEWAKSGTSTYYEKINCIGSNTDGNLYAAGQIIAPFVKIDSLVGIDTLIVVTDTILSPDILLLSYAPDGSLLWQKNIQGLGDDQATHLSPAPDNRFFIAGTFTDTLYFITDTLNSKNKFDFDVFTALLNADGSLQWVRQVGGIGDATAAALSSDANGNAFSGFNYLGAVSLQPGDTLPPQPGIAYFGVTKYSATGNLEWHKIGSSSGSVNLAALATDAEGFTYAAGYFTGILSFGNIVIGSLNETDAFLAKISPNGSVLWLKTLPGMGNQSFTGITTGATGQLYVCGQFNQPFEWNGNTTTPTGNVSAFVAQYNAATGNLQWLTPLGGEAVTDTRSVRLDMQGNPWVGGNFYPTFFYGADTLYTQGAEDMYVCKLDATGSVLWVQILGGIYAETLTGFAFDANNNLYAGGAFENQSIYGNDTLAAAGLSNYLLFKIGAQVVSTVQPLPAAAVLGLQVYPNPARQTTTVTISGNNDSNTQIALCDIHGKIWLQEVVYAGMPTQVLPLHELAPGMYLLHAATPKAQAVVKLIVW